MDVVNIVGKLFLISFLLNFVWEVFHSELYITTQKMLYMKRIMLLTVMSLKDAFWISFFYLLSIPIFNTADVFENRWHIVSLIGAYLLFSFIDEKISVKLSRWEYAPAMPLIFGVGLTSLLELGVTAFVSFAVIFLL